MHVCAYVYMYTCLYVYIYMYVHIYMHTNMHIYNMCVCVYVTVFRLSCMPCIFNEQPASACSTHVHVGGHSKLHVCKHSHMYVSVRLNTCTYRRSIERDVESIRHFL